MSDRLPVVSGGQLIQALEQVGWESVRQRGAMFSSNIPIVRSLSSFHCLIEQNVSGGNLAIGGSPMRFSTGRRLRPRNLQGCLSSIRKCAQGGCWRVG